jgi:hypothetical protein
LRDERRERGGQHDAQDERQDDDRDLDGRRDDDPQQGDRDEQAPAPLAETVEPDRHQRVRRQRRFGLDAEHGDERPADGQREGNDRDRDEQADDAAEGRTGRQCDQRDRRMDVDGLVVDHRGQELALDEGQDRDQDEEHDRRGRSDRPQRDEHDEDGRHQPADVRDEAPEEDDDGKRRRQGDTEDDQEDPDGDPVERGDDGRAAKVATDAL